MRAVIQRVLRSSVRVEDEVVNSIERGLLIFIGIQSDDDVSDLEYIVKKVLTTKLWTNGDKQCKIEFIFDINNFLFFRGTKCC
jgi:D-tyrosyl-tRNA(Tyr) deacylase